MSAARGRDALLALLAVAMAAALVVAVVIAAARSGEEAGAVPVAELGPQGRVPQFKVECAWSHAAPDDPIVHPGAPGRSHRHDFFGNETTDAHSTAAEMLEGPTSCQNQLDTAAYWAPALLVDGRPVEPTGSVAYYRAAPQMDPTALQPYPAGLMMIAGDPAAEAPQSLAVAAWHCGASPSLSAEPPTCPASAPLGVRVAFPDCWDGSSLDADDHRSHVARQRRGRVPRRPPGAAPPAHLRGPLPGVGRPRRPGAGLGGRARGARRLRERVGPSRPGARDPGLPQRREGLWRRVEPRHRLTRSVTGAR